MADGEFADSLDTGGLALDILDRLSSGLCIVDHKWRFVHANRAAREIWGAGGEAITSTVLWERFPQLVGSEAERLLRSAVAAGKKTGFEVFCPIAQRRLRFRIDPLRAGITGIFLQDGAGGTSVEATERSRVERLRIADTAKLGYWEHDIATGALWSSAHARLNHGRPPAAELGYDMVLAAIDPDYRDIVLQAASRAVTERTEYEVEYPLTWPDGSRHWISLRGGCVYAEDGRPQRNVAVTIDITARKQSEDALRLSEERLRLAQEGAGVGVWDWDPETNQIYWSPQMFRLFGLDPLHPPADLYEAWLGVVHPADREQAHAFSQRRRDDPGPSEFAYRIIRPDGELRWILAKGMAVGLSAGRPARVAGIDIDITEAKRVEGEFRRLTEELEARVDARTRELAEVNDRLRRERLLSELIIENASEGIIVIDTEMRHLVWNAGIESVNGLPRSQVLGKTVFEVFPQFRDHPVGHAWREALAGRRAEIRDYRFFSSERGAEIVYDADFTPLYAQTGTIIGAICMLRETTERHRMEDMLRQSQKMEAIAQLTGGVAHDFNNLLTAVVGCLEMISLESPSGDVANLANTALRSANRGAQLTQQLLAFARRQSLRPVVADLNALLAEIEVLLRRAAGEAIELTLDPAPGLLNCEVDPAQFEAAAMNLVMNARDAMPQGGRLILTTSAVELRDRTAGLDLQSGHYVAFSVCDSGHGMTPEVLGRAFEPFYTTKEIGKGSGLGLSMVYGFAKQSGGGVQIESTAGIGTCVTLYLPRALTAEAGPDRTGRFDQPQHGSGSILVVEDDEDVREVSVAMLEGLGYRVLVAGDAHEALGALRSAEPIDLLFTDLVMPRGMSGVALARQARSLRPGLRILLTTGYAGLEASDTEEFPIILKPFRPAELGRKVAQLLDETSG